jgi:hypothetical protein
MRDWQTERYHRGENPFDWQTFRTAVHYMGSCDPGGNAPAEFFWFTSLDGAPVTFEAVVGTPPSTAKGPSARLAAPGRDRGAGGSGEALTEVKYWR